MKITACPKCGSKNIEVGTLDSGVTFGVTSWKEVCRECGYQGQPLLFESEKEYNEFLEELKSEEQKTERSDQKEPPVDDTADELDELSPKEKEVVSLLKEYDKEKTGQPIWPKKKAWWPEIIVALLIAIISYFTGFTNLASLMGIGMALLYGVLNIISNFVIYLFVIVIVEYVYYFIKNMIFPKNS
jgi:hypothetical protein